MPQMGYVSGSISALPPLPRPKFSEIGAVEVEIVSVAFMGSNISVARATVRGSVLSCLLCVLGAYLVLLLVIMYMVLPLAIAMAC